MSYSSRIDKVIEIVRRQHDNISDEHMIDILAIADQAATELAQLRADNGRLETVYQLAVAECVKACNERDMHKRNWTNTMAHRDRLQAQAEQLHTVANAANMLWNYLDAHPKEKNNGRP